MVADKEPCPHCGRKVVPNYMTTHLRRMHNIYRGRGRRRQDVDAIELIRNLPEMSAPVPPPQSPPEQEFIEVTGMIIIQRKDGTLWIAEKLDRDQ